MAITRDERTARKIADRWKVSPIRFAFDDRRELGDQYRWKIEGRCLARGQPVEHWLVHEFYMLGHGVTLEAAMIDALQRPMP